MVADALTNGVPQGARDEKWGICAANCEKSRKSGLLWAGF
jgi:hypothetical protein